MTAKLGPRLRGDDNRTAEALWMVILAHAGPPFLVRNWAPDFAGMTSKRGPGLRGDDGYAASFFLNDSKVAARPAARSTVGCQPSARAASEGSIDERICSPGLAGIMRGWAPVPAAWARRR